MLAFLIALLALPRGAAAEDRIAGARPTDRSEPGAAAVKRLTDRIRPIQQRLEEDERLRAAERVVGLGMAAVGVLRGQATLSSVGTQALRLGLNREFAAFRERSGFVVEPSFNSHGFSITFRKNLD